MKEAETSHLDNAPCGEVYFCFQGPLEAQLKQEVKEKKYGEGIT